MFGLDFLFSAALWALPLAGLPLVLHLLFRQRSPVVLFSTIRFVQASIRQTAARKKIHRWLLLACRALLIALLVWALAQPARRYAAASFSGAASTAAAIVADTSYSMLLHEQQTTLLQEADAAVQDLLRGELRDASVAIFRGDAPSPPRLAPSVSYRGDRWETLAPTPSAAPLLDEINAAAALLSQSGADRKVLVVLTDAQSREFPHPLASMPDIQTLIIDLHPAGASAAAIIAVATDPPHPRIGIPAHITVDLLGRPAAARDLTLAVQKKGARVLDSQQQTLPPLPLARFDDTGRASLRAPFVFSNTSSLLITARLTASEPLAWAASRTQLVEIPPRAAAAVLTVGPASPLDAHLMRLALDPGENAAADWPVAVHDGPPSWSESLVVARLTDWPDMATLNQMQSFARGGGVLVLFLQPGLEAAWPSLPPARQQALAALLPSPPPAAASLEEAYNASILKPTDPILADIGDPRAAEPRLTVTRLIRFSAVSRPAQTIINAAPADPASTQSPTPLLIRKPIGAGVVYTWATIPDRSCGNLAVWDLFPPTLVNAASAAPAASADSAALNVPIGAALTLPANKTPPGAEVDILPPNSAPIAVKPNGAAYRFASAAAGLYTWQYRLPSGQTEIAAYANVQYPADEARLTYRPIAEITGNSPAIIAGHSLEEIRRRLTRSDQPTPQWTLPIALVLLLLCLEALLGAAPRGWRSTNRPKQPIIPKS